MKMKYLLPIFTLALIVAGCNKADIDTPSNNDGPQATEQLATLKAEIVNSKTSYDDEGKFSWVAADKITVVVWNDGSTDGTKLNALDHYTYNNSTGAGVTATFTGSAINSPWNELGVALYPNKNVSTYNCLQEAGAYDTGLQVTVNQEIRPTLDNPLEVVPLIGRKNAQGVYQFKTAMGILKVTVSDIPADAYYLYLQDPSSSYAFSGTFAVGDQDEIRAEDAVSPSGNAFKKTVAFVPEAAGETRTFYIPIPTGTIPAGVQLKLDRGYPTYENVMTKTFTKPVTITANHVTPLAAVVAESWTSLGTGKFMDDNGFYATSGTSPHVSVTIEQNDNDSDRYRVVNPYQAYMDLKNISPDVDTPDPYFYFTIKEDGSVEYSNYYTSLYYYGPWYQDQYGVFSIVQSSTVSTNTWNNFVLKSDGSGNPLNVQIAPGYVAKGKIVANCTQNPKIEIVFPGGTEMMTIANYANNGTVTYADGVLTANVGNYVSAIRVVLASDLASGVAALKAGGSGIITFTASGTETLTGYENGSYRMVYVVETDGHGYTFKDGGAVQVFNPEAESGLLTLDESMITVNSDAGTYAGTSWYDGVGKKGLVDSDLSTFWHSAYSAAEGYTSYYQWGTDFDPEYGICIDIALPEAIDAFHLSYYIRHNNNNGRPREIKFAGSNDGTTWYYITTVSNDDMANATTSSPRVDLPSVTMSTAYSHLRIGITKAGDGPSDLTVAKGGSTALGEILLYKD